LQARIAQQNRRKNMLLQYLLSKNSIISFQYLLSEYLFIFIFIVLSLTISCIVFGLSYILSTRSVDKEKVSAYECGFNPFEDARNQFDVRFYLVAILFIIFDLEVSFLFPWAVTLNQLTLFSFWSMFLFLVILTIGFIYEWKKGALEWE
jgi:NADH:ubiquinone oxidoreductase subunit 3 (subunit A)